MADIDVLQELSKYGVGVKLVEDDGNITEHGHRAIIYKVNNKGNVSSVNISDARIDIDIEITSHFLKELSQLEELDLSNHKVKDISFLREMQGLVSLQLARNQISDLTPIQHLENLTFLNVSGNLLSDIESVSNLRNLKHLSFTSNKIQDIAPLAELSRLERLELGNNKIRNNDILSKLTSLVYLDYSGSGLTRISFLKDLSSLHTLYLHGNKIKVISVLEYLPGLCNINIGRNYISDLSPVKAINKLKSLWLINNPITDFTPISALTELERLSIGSNKALDLSWITNMTNLKRLDAQDNEISDITPLSGLTELRQLDLSNNKIEDISALKNLKKLYRLQLMNNPISRVPSWIMDLDLKIVWSEYGHYDGQITFFNNPITTPPIDIIKQGRAAIARYFKNVQEQGIDYLYEAKLILVGEGSAGKTSLQSRLMNSKAALPKKDTRTRGIKIFDWKFKTIKGKPQVAHIWDFGGQDVYYPVHRFFLTENSVFVLLASTRQTHHNFDYWIPTIYQFGGASPIILGQTCHEGNKAPWNDLGYYLSNVNFNIIKNQSQPYYELDLPKKNEGLAKIKKAIIDQILELPHYGKGIPTSWIAVRNALLEKSKKSPCISFDAFVSLCRNENEKSFDKLVDIEDCLKFLHSIGVVLWYYNNEDLKNWIVLQPEWAMNAVYKIIDDEEIQRRKGIILAKDFTRLWKEAHYEGMHHILKKMLEVFKIAFPKKHKKDDYIIPARLLSMPAEQKWQHDEPCLRLEHRYEFMPKGMVNQISAELSRFIITDEQVWNNAVNFCNENNTAQAQVEEDFYNRKISLKAKGRDARGLIMIIMNALKDITDGYKGVKPEIYVPCTCAKCNKSSKPTQFLYDDLLRWYAENRNKPVFCNESGEILSIEELLYNVGLSGNGTPVSTTNQIVKLFLASSSEMKDDREQFEIFINRENKRLAKEGIFIELNIWEDFIDAMSATRLQDEYNKVVEESDIFVSLFFTKVGKFTEEEFEKAFTQFKNTGKPRIYTYFKGDNKKVDQLNRDDINSKFNFEEKLKSLGHYPTIYKNIGDLKYQFKLQLEEILPSITK